jgi:curved DNA-binding protein
MYSHYQTLGLTNAASSTEIRRAYRILARRYHPDVNPNENTEALFKEIAQAYAVLSDPERKQQYDLELKQSTESFQDTFQRAQDALKRNQRARAYAEIKRQNSSANDKKPNQASTKSNSYTSAPKPSGANSARNLSQRLKHLGDKASVTLANLTKAADGLQSLVKRKIAQRAAPLVGQLILLEQSISIADSIAGMKKTVEIPGQTDSARKVSITIPPGVRTGSIVRFRGSDGAREEIVLIIRVESHPWLSVGERGITMEVPLTIGEAIEGAKIQVPSCGEPLLVTVEPGTQSGKEVRLKGQGITQRDGTRGDLYIRFMIKIPDAPFPEEILTLKELLVESYKSDIRANLPKRIPE